MIKGIRQSTAETAPPEQEPQQDSQLQTNRLVFHENGKHSLACNVPINYLKLLLKLT